MRRRVFLAGIGGAPFAVPAAANAQQKAVPIIGVLSSGGRGGPAQAFYRGLSEAGYDEGQNVTIEYRVALGDYDQLPTLTADLVTRKVDLIAAFGPPAARAAKDATSSVPIVFISGDPIAERLVASLARPGGNATGVSLITVELMSKRFELLSALVPHATAFALLVNPNTANSETMIGGTQDAARAKGVQLHVMQAGTGDDELDAAFATMVERGVGAVIVGTEDLWILRIPYIVALAARYRIPAIFVSSEFAWSGGLISYGPVPEEAYRQGGVYAGRILRGTKPADLPVLQPTRFELVINLKTANALGLTVPQLLLTRADEVIE